MPERKRVLVVAWASYHDLLQGVQQFLLLHLDLHLHVCMINLESPRNAQRLRQRIGHVRPAGILAPATTQNEAMLQRAGVPVVNISDTIRTTLPTVMFDQVRIGSMAAEHLLEQGLRTFAFAFRAGFYHAALRWQGFHDRLRQEGMEAHLFDDFYQVAAGKPIPDAAIRRWITWLPKPVGIHLSDTSLAMEVIWACQELGLRVPEDVAVLGGMDREFLTTTWEPALSAFETPRWRLGFDGMKLLDGLMRGRRPPDEPILLPSGNVIGRQSTNVLMMRDREVAQALSFIRENAHRPILVDDVLRAVPLSRRALERRFVKVMNRSLHDEILKAHIERAKTLLAQSNLSIAQVAEKAGFANYRAFSGAFRKETGMTSKQCRAQSEQMG